jgi:hypothetical protein
MCLTVKRIVGSSLNQTFFLIPPLDDKLSGKGTKQYKNRITKIP